MLKGIGVMKRLYQMFVVTLLTLLSTSAKRLNPAIPQRAVTVTVLVCVPFRSLSLPWYAVSMEQRFVCERRP